MIKNYCIKLWAQIFYAGIICSTHLFAQKTAWQNLFNGKDLGGWKCLAGSAKFEVEDSAIVGTSIAGSGNTFLVTEKEYGNFILELDVKVEDTTGNSGIQIRSHFDEAINKVYGKQVEVDASARQWSGGIYDEARRGWLYPLDLNPAAKRAFRVGEYNHFHIECISNEIKTFVNGMAVAYLVDTLDSKGFIGLQVHSTKKPGDAGKKIWFKNIRIQTTALEPRPFAQGVYVVNNTINSLNAYEKQNAWQLLFDGKTSNGWHSARDSVFPRNGWVIKDGILTILSSAGKEAANGGDIVTDKEYSAFDLSFSFKLTPGANSGVKYFVTLAEKTDGSAIGLEYQLLDDSLHPDAKMGRDGNRTLASLYDLIKANKESRFIHQPGEWNTGRIVVYPDNKVEHYLNGVKVLEYARGSEAYNVLVAISKYKVWPNFGTAAKGHILLQDHGNEVNFANIKIRELK